MTEIFVNMALFVINTCISLVFSVVGKSRATWTHLIHCDPIPALPMNPGLEECPVVVDRSRGQWWVQKHMSACNRKAQCVQEDEEIISRANNHSDMYVRVPQDELTFPEDKSMDQSTLHPPNRPFQRLGHAKLR